jgi:hypothetical protein
MTSVVKLFLQHISSGAIRDMPRLRRPTPQPEALNALRSPRLGDKFTPIVYYPE